MILVFAMMFEFMMCWLFSPTADTDMSGVAIILLIVNTVILMAVTQKDLKRHNCNYLSIYIIFGLFFRIVLLLWDVYARNIYVLPNSEGDAVWYHQIAVSYAFGTRQGSVDITDFSYYVGLIYKLIGVQKVTAQSINVYLSIFSILLVIRIMCMLGVDDKSKATAVKLMCFLPNLAIINSIFLQETIVSFCIVASVYLYTKWWYRKSAGSFIGAIAVSVCGALLHIGGLVSAMGIVISYPFVRSRKLNISASKLILSLVSAMVVLIIISNYGSGLLGKIGGKLSVDSIVSSSGQTDRTSDADYLIGDTGMSSTASLILLTPVRMIYFVCSPLPWMWRGISDIIAFFGSALFYIATVRSAWKGFRLMQSEDGAKAYAFTIIIILIMAAFMFGWGVSNTGTALRHREKFTFLCALLYGISAQWRATNESINYGNNSGIPR